MITDIEELIKVLKSKLSDYLALHGIDNPTKHFSCIAPEHEDKTPSMNMHKDGTFIKCHSCGKNLDIFSASAILDEYPNEGSEFITGCVFKLADKLGIKYNIISSSSEKIALKQNYLRAYKIVCDYIKDVTKENSTEAFIKELDKRKWPKLESIKAGLGCVHSFKDVLNLLLNNGFTKEFIDLIGLMRADVFNKDNILFSIFDEYGHPIAFYSRDTKFEEKKLAYENRDKLDISNSKSPMKFNSTANFTGIYEKSLNPYGLHDIKNSHTVILVEGHGCKHSLRLNGIDNVIALGGLAFNDQLVNKLVRLGVTKLVLLLDNDNKGKEKVKSIIKQFYGKMLLDLAVLDLASVYNDVKDPDELIRKKSVEAFRQIPEKNALEWYAINELFDKTDSYLALQEVIPIIALEKSPINRRRIESIIADITNLDKNDIHDEVEQKISSSKDRKGEIALKVLDEAKDILISNPSAIDAVNNLINTKLGNIGSNDNNEDLFSNVEVLRELGRRQEQQDLNIEDPVCKTGFNEFDRLIQLPLEEALVLVPGSPNTMKTTLSLNKALGVLRSTQDSIVILHTTDDSRNIYFDRLVSCLSGIKINWIKKPGIFLDETLQRKRNDAYKELTEYIRSGRLIIKDVIHGDTVEYHGKLVRHYRDKNPSKPLFVVCDNFHRLNTEIGESESRLKYKYISAMMKDYTTKYSCIEWCTVEMNKMRMYERHTTPETIAEAGSIQFDANLILFLYNEVNSLREEAKKVFNSTSIEYHKDAGYIHKPIIRPLIEMLVLKNKVSEFKGSLWYKGFAELGYVEQITKNELDELIGGDS